MASRTDTIVGLDIGTTKIAVVVAERQPDGSLDIIGVGTHPSKGLRKGVVINIEATVESIMMAVEEAQVMSGKTISGVYAGIAGSHIKGFNSHGIVAIKNSEVAVGDINRVIDAARAVAMPNDREILHILPQDYIVDEQDGIKEPLGMSGVRLEAKVHIITALVSSVQNIVKSANRVGLNVLDVVLEPIASAEAVLSQEEKELGVALVDIGGGTTDINIFYNGSVRHTAVIPLGGNHLTSDIATGLRTPTSAAEHLKARYGTAASRFVGPDEIIEVPQTGGREPREVSRALLANIIEPRFEEIMSLVHRELIVSGYEELLTAGLVLTGGSVLLDRSTEAAEDIIGLPVRIGRPMGVGGLLDVVGSPAFATGVGLVLYGASMTEVPHPLAASGPGVFTRLRKRVVQWFSEYF